MDKTGENGKFSQKAENIILVLCELSTHSDIIYVTQIYISQQGNKLKSCVKIDEHCSYFCHFVLALGEFRSNAALVPRFTTVFIPRCSQNQH